MSDQKYNEVLKFIKSSLVPKNDFDESQNEILNLKMAVETANNELKQAKFENEEHKLANNILQAEKESLEAEKITFQIKFNEVSLKLKQKTKQYDSLLNSQRSVSTVPATIKQEPTEIGIVNVPSSSTSRYDESIRQKIRPKEKRQNERKEKIGSPPKPSQSLAVYNIFMNGEYKYKRIIMKILIKLVRQIQKKKYRRFHPLRISKIIK